LGALVAVVQNKGETFLVGDCKKCQDFSYSRQKCLQSAQKQSLFLKKKRGETN